MTLKHTISAWLSPKNPPSPQRVLSSIQIEGDHILVRFSEPIEYLELTPDLALRWAEMLLHQAGTINRDLRSHDPSTRP